MRTFHNQDELIKKEMKKKHKKFRDLRKNGGNTCLYKKSLDPKEQTPHILLTQELEMY